MRGALVFFPSFFLLFYDCGAVGLDPFSGAAAFRGAFAFSVPSFLRFLLRLWLSPEVDQPSYEQNGKRGHDVNSLRREARGTGRSGVISWKFYTIPYGVAPRRWENSTASV